MTLLRIRALYDELLQASEQCCEAESEINFKFSLVNLTLQEKLVEFSFELSALGCASSWEYATDSGQDYSLEDPSLVSANYRYVKIVKPKKCDLTKFFICADHLADWAQSFGDKWEVSPKIFVLFLKMPFSTETCSVELWTADSCSLAPPKPVEPVVTSPHRIVRFTDRNACPNNALAWVPKTVGSISPKIAAVLAEKMSLCLAPELSIQSSGQIEIRLRSARTGKIQAPSPLPDTVDDLLLTSLSTACRWIYSSALDSDVKHGLLMSEIAREWDPDQNWLPGLRGRLDPSLTNSKYAYQMHLHELGSNALKQMSELRKTLSDDVGRLSGVFSSIQGSIWRDATIVMGFIILRASSLNIFEFMYLVIIGYLISGSIVNYLHIKSISKSVQHGDGSFRRRLYHFVPEGDFRSIYEDPINSALFKTWMVYLISVALALALGLFMYASREDMGKNELPLLIKIAEIPTIANHASKFIDMTVPTFQILKPVNRAHINQTYLSLNEDREPVDSYSPTYTEKIK